MTRMAACLFSCAILLVAISARAHPQVTEILNWRDLAPLPDSRGVAGAFGGVSNGALIVAGGTNFPDAPPWANGKKAYYDTVYVLEKPEGSWESGFRLPRPLAYGVAITTEKGLVCIGGSDAERHYRDVFVLEWVGGGIRKTALPPLPGLCANACGAKVGNVIYVAGGIESPSATSATKNFWSLDFSESRPSWKVLEPWPGPERMLAVAAAQDDSFFLISGVRLVSGGDGKPKREYLRDAYRYSPGKRWTRIADLPHSVAGAPSPAAAMGPSHILIFGGEDGSKVDFEPRDNHPGFSSDLLGYHTITNTWTVLGAIPAPRVTTALASWAEGFVVPSGEVRPGVRSPKVLLAGAIRQRTGFGWLNYTALALYLAAMVAMGFHFVGRQKSTNQFFRAGQRVPWWAAGMSIFATLLSSITYMAIPAKAYATNWAYIMNHVTIVLLAPVAIYGYLPFFRQLDVTSAYEYLEKRFNLAARLFASASFILFQIGRMTIVLYLPAIALATVSSMDVYTCILIMGGLCIVYAVLGGIEAVIWTDVVQAVVLLGGIAISLVLILTHCEGGVAGFMQAARSNGKFFEDVVWGWDATQATVLVVLIGGFFTNMVPYTASQDVVQRYVTTKNQKLAARAIWTNAAISFSSAFLFFGMGTALFVFYKTYPQHLDPSISTDAIFPLFIVREMPAGLAGLVVAGIFAAAQSTLASSLNSVATAWVTDFHRRFRPQSSDRANLRLARWLTVILGIMATAAACVIASVKVASLWDMFLQIMGLTGSALAGLFALGIFTRRANGRGAIVGALASVITLYVAQQHGHFHLFLYGAIGVLTCVGVGYGASLVIRGFPRPLDGLTIFTVRSRKAE